MPEKYTLSPSNVFLEHPVTPSVNERATVLVVDDTPQPELALQSADGHCRALGSAVRSRHTGQSTVRCGSLCPEILHVVSVCGVVQILHLDLPSLPASAGNAANGFCEALTDEAGAGSWPMTSGSYIVIKKTSDNRERRQALLNFLGWGLRVGDMEVANLDFMPVERSILRLIRDSWNDSPLNLDGATKVNAAQVKDLLANGVPIVDARITAEYDASHIPRAISVTYLDKSAKSANFNPLQDTHDLSKLPSNKNAPVIIYCNAAACWKSYKLSTAAIKAGYQKVYWFRGGIPEWLENGYKIERLGSSASK